MSRVSCYAKIAGVSVELHAPAFVYHLNTSNGLSAEWWLNRLTGQRVHLGHGAEVELDLDTAYRRIQITGWRIYPAENDERSFTHPALNDSDWPAYQSPAQLPIKDNTAEWWARTHVFLPESAADQPLTLRLGGIGIFDFQLMDIFINGQPIGRRRVMKRWHEPGSFDLSTNCRGHRALRFGQDNVIALRLSGRVTRTTALEEIDPVGARNLPAPFLWPAQFEQYLVVGQPAMQPTLLVERVVTRWEGESARVEIMLAGTGVEVTIAYTWDATQPVLLKQVMVRNTWREPVYLAQIKLGQYRTRRAVSEGEQGFPVYIDKAFFLTLAHPAGWATGQDSRIELTQYPSEPLQPGIVWQAMEAILGVGEAGKARDAFKAHLRTRMRRIRRNHGPLAIFEPFGGNPEMRYEETEAYLLDNLAKVRHGARHNGCRFDIYCLEFWMDTAGDLERADTERFPRGLSPVTRAIQRAGMAPGLWFDSSMAGWSIGRNPAITSCYTHDPAYPPGASFLCRASDPFATMFSTACCRHCHEHGVRLFKFDNLSAICYHPGHDHWPGVYSTEAIYDAVIRTLSEIDEECPDAFLMLYWGYRSPWWLQYADTLFEPGLNIEAASPARQPTLYARDGVMRGLDQAQWWCGDVPSLGKDSLGVWLSDWGWNSSIGAERWQEGMTLDLCRGSLLIQPWSDTDWLSPAERERMAEFIALLKANAACFNHDPRFVLGNPWQDDLYGYCCAGTERALLVINNNGWSDAYPMLELNPSWGLSGEGPWDIYRWHPEPARLFGPGGSFGTQPIIPLRPFEMALLEITPRGIPPSLQRRFCSVRLPEKFNTPTQPISLEQERLNPQGARSVPGDADPGKPGMAPPVKHALLLRGSLPASRNGGMLVIMLEMTVDNRALSINNVGRFLIAEAQIDNRSLPLIPVMGEWTYPAAWQAWRAALPAIPVTNEIEVIVTALLDARVNLSSRAYFIPAT